MNASRATVEEGRPTHHPDYDVSNFGRVRSRMPLRGRGPRLPEGTGRIIRSAPNSQGYLQFVMGGHFGKSTKVHRLVAAAFLGPCPKGQEVRHKNGDAGNACADNLEYGTRSQNRLDCVRHGTDRSPRGEKCSLAKISNAQAKDIKRRISLIPRVGTSQRRPKGSLTTLAKEVGLPRSALVEIAYERSWYYV